MQWIVFPKWPRRPVFCRAPFPLGLAVIVFTPFLISPAAACSAYSCDGVGWQDYDPENPGVMAAFQAARRQGTATALERFIEAYPGSPAASEALDLKAEIERQEPEARR